MQLPETNQQKTSFFVLTMHFIKLLILSISISGFGQMLDNTNGKTLGETPFFNEDFVKRNKLKSMKGSYSTKADLDYIRGTKDVYYYEFNENGQLIKEYRTQYKDTIISHYTYNDEGQIAELRRSDNGGFYTYIYTYDESGRVLSKEYRRDLNKTGDKMNFQLDRTFSVNTEHFSYMDFDGMDYKKVFYNGIGKVYKEEFYYHNEFGNLKTQESRLKMGTGFSKTTYTYDFKGRVASKKEENQTTSKSVSEWRYEYDEFDNVLAQFYYRNNEYMTEHQIVYDESTYMLGAIILRDEPTNFVTILQFTEYTYFDE